MLDAELFRVLNEIGKDLILARSRVFPHVSFKTKASSTSIDGSFALNTSYGVA